MNIRMLALYMGEFVILRIRPHVPILDFRVGEFGQEGNGLPAATRQRQIVLANQKQ
jgi:hypothetical protein